MAQCDTGYFCQVCGEYVENIFTSELYLRFVMGRVPFKELFSSPDAHIWCNANLDQYITDPEYKPPTRRKPRTDKSSLDPAVVAQREDLTSRAWSRLQEVAGLGLPVEDYPLPEVRNASTDSTAP